jgi:hypothetical protein
MTTMSTQKSNEVNQATAKLGDISLNSAQVCTDFVSGCAVVARLVTEAGSVGLGGRELKFQRYPAL